MLWDRQDPENSIKSSFSIAPAENTIQKSAPKGLAWEGIELSSDLVRDIAVSTEGEASWEELRSRFLTRPTPPKPSPYFGRELWEQRVLDLLLKNDCLILEGQPEIGRTFLARGLAHSKGSRWVDGINHLDFSQGSRDEKVKELLALKPEEAAQLWRSRHQLVVLDHVDLGSAWISKTLEIVQAQGSLANILIIPSKNSSSSRLPRTVIAPLDFETFSDIAREFFGLESADDILALASVTGRMPGVITHFLKSLDTSSRTIPAKESLRSLSKHPALLDKLGSQIDELDDETYRMLRHICCFSSQVSLNLTSVVARSDAHALSLIANLIERGWLYVEEDGYRVPNPLIMAVRKKKPLRDDDWALAAKALVAEAESLSKRGTDLAPTKNLTAYKRLLRTGYDALKWLSQQDDQIDLNLTVVGLIWVSALTEGFSEEFLILTDRLYHQLDNVPISSKTVLYWEARGRHMRTRGDLPASLEAHERGYREALELNETRGALWNLHFKAACLSLMARRQEAEAAYEELIPQWRKHGTQKDIAYGLCTLCLHFFRYRQLDLMPDVLVEAFSVARKSDEVGLLTAVKELQGWLAHAAGDYVKSIELMDEAELLANQGKHARRDLIGLGRGLAYWLMGYRREGIACLYDMMELPHPIEAISRFSLEMHLSQMEAMIGDLAPAAARIISLNQRMIDGQARIWMGDLMDLNALVAYRMGHHSSAAILAGCGFHWHSLTNRGTLEIEKAVRFWMPDCRQLLGESQFQARFQAGAHLDPDKLLSLSRVDYALISQMLPDLFETENSDKPLLSSRQKDVVRLASQGLSNKQIAEALFLEEGTVKRHLHNAAQELGVKGRLALVRKAVDLGLIP
jgi:DNA-binding CsgD family transcriptional regulator